MIFFVLYVCVMRIIIEKNSSRLSLMFVLSGLETTVLCCLDNISPKRLFFCRMFIFLKKYSNTIFLFSYIEEHCFFFVKVICIQTAADFWEIGKFVILIPAALSTLLGRTLVGDGDSFAVLGTGYPVEHFISLS